MPGPGHHAGVGRDEARHPAVEPLRHAGGRGRRWSAPVSSGSLQWISKYGGSARRKSFGAVLALRPAGAVRLDLGQRARVLERRARGRRSARGPSASAASACTSSISPRAPRSSASRGVIQTSCTVSAASCEPCWPSGASATKKRVSKRRERPGRGDPVAEVGELARGDVEVLGSRAVRGTACLRQCISASARAAPIGAPCLSHASRMPASSKHSRTAAT